jgi:phage terminase large subunit
MDRPERILSTEFDLIYAQEATELSLEDWETLISRLRNGVLPYQQIVGDCNPGPAQHWLKKRSDPVVDDVSGEVVGVPLLRLLESRHEDNPALYTAGGELTPFGVGYMGRLDRLSGVRYQRLRRGLWVSAEGAVFEDFDPSVHVVDEHELPGFVRRFVSVDFGFTNPLVVQWWGEDSDGRLFLYREFYRTKTLVQDAAGVMNPLCEADGVFAAGPVCDHDAEDRATLERHLRISAPGGGRTVTAFKAVSPGLEAVRERLRLAGDGRPRLFFVRGALIRKDMELEAAGRPTSSLQEIEQYVWQEGRDGRPNREEPAKEFDHGMDAMRYLVAFVDKLRAPKKAVRAGIRPRIRRYAR